MKNIRKFFKAFVDINLSIALLFVLFIGGFVIFLISNADEVTIIEDTNAILINTGSDTSLENIESEQPKTQIITPPDASSNVSEAPQPITLKIEGDTGTTFTLADHDVEIESVAYRDQSEAGLTGLSGIGNSGKLLWIGLKITNNTGNESSYSLEHYKMNGLGTIYNQSYFDDDFPLPITKADGADTFFYIIFDLPQIDGRPVFLWNPDNTQDSLELTLPDATEIFGYN